RSVRVFRRDFVPQDAGGRDSDPNKLLMSSVSITYSVGDAGPLNHAEQIAVNSFVEWHRPDRSQLLLLPTSAQRPRRFARGVYKSNPDKVKRVVVASGDSVSLNNVYRDSEVVWDYRDLPVPLLFFSHRNPVDEAAGFQQVSTETGRPSKTGTQGLLLYRDIFDAPFPPRFPPPHPL